METEKYLKKVVLASDVYAVCIQHALTTEKQEIMGLLIGQVCMFFMSNPIQKRLRSQIKTRQIKIINHKISRQICI